MEESKGNTKELPRVRERGQSFVFICYSHDDSDEVFADLKLLNQSGIGLWYDEGISAGTDWTGELAASIDDCELFLFYVSANSISSNHCSNECLYAIDKEKTVLTVYLSDVELPPGLQLTLGSKQAIHRYRYSAADYQDRLLTAMHQVLSFGTFDSVESDAPRSRTKRKSLTAVFAAVGALTILLVLMQTSFMRDLLIRSPTDSGSPHQDESRLEPSLAVLPFTTTSEQTTHKNIGEAFSNQILTSLSRIAPLKITPRTDSLAFAREKRAGIGSEAIGAQLNVNYLLDGDTTFTDDTVELSVYLTDVQKGYNVWTDRFEIQSADPGKLPDHIRTLIIEAIKINAITPTPEQLAQLGTDSMEAYRAFQLGRYHHQTWNPLEIEKAIRFYELAIELDPDFYRAYGEIATSLSDSRFFLPSEESIRVAKNIIKKIDALDLKGADDSRYYDLFVLHLVDWDIKELERLLREGIESNRLSAQLYGAYGFWVLRPSGLLEEAKLFIEYANEHAVARDEYDRTEMLLWRAHMFAAFGEYAKSDRSLEDCYKIETSNLLCRSLGFFNALQTGRIDRAIEFQQIIKELQVSRSINTLYALFIATVSGDVREISRLLAVLEADPSSIPFAIGLMHHQLGNIDEGFRWLNIALDVKDPNLLHNLNNGNFQLPAHVKTDPRYQDLVNRTGLTAEWKTELLTLLPEIPDA